MSDDFKYQPGINQPQPEPAQYQHHPAHEPQHGQPGQSQPYQHPQPHGQHQSYAPQYQYAPRPSMLAPVTSFIGALFDIKFSSFITTKLISLLYILGIVVSAIITLMFIIMGFSADALAGLVVLLFSPIVLLAVLAVFRVGLEAVVIIFKIAEFLKSIDAKLK